LHQPVLSHLSKPTVHERLDAGDEARVLGCEDARAGAAAALSETSVFADTLSVGRDGERWIDRRARRDTGCFTGLIVLSIDPASLGSEPLAG